MKEQDKADLAALRAALDAKLGPEPDKCDTLPRTKAFNQSWWSPRGKPLGQILRESIPKLGGAPPYPSAQAAPEARDRRSGAPPALRRRSALDRNERAKVARLLEAYNRRTREVGAAGRRNQGALKASGVDVGKELLFCFYNPNTGQLDPEDASIARETGWSVRTVRRARERLRASGLLSWFRRSKWAGGRWHPTSNRYAFGQIGRESPIKNLISWGRKVAAQPSALLTGLCAEFGVVGL